MDYSLKFLPIGFKLDKNNPLHLFVIKKILNNILQITFNRQVSCKFITYPDFFSENNEDDTDIIYISSDFKSIDTLIGNVLYEASRIYNDNDFDSLQGQLINHYFKSIKQKYNFNDNETQQYLTDKIFLLINIVLIQKTLNILKQTTPGFYKYVQTYFDSIFKSRFFNDNSSILSTMFKNNNWDTYSYYLMNIFVFRNKLTENIFDELQEIKIFDDETIVENVKCWFDNFENKSQIENEYTQSEEYLNSLEKRFEKQKQVIFNNIKKISITPKTNYKINAFDVSKLKLTSEKFNNEFVQIVEIDNYNNLIVQNDIFKLFERNKKLISYFNKYILTDGIKQGKSILKQLQYRDNVNVIRNEYLKEGKINQRFLYKTAYNENRIFYKNNIISSNYKCLYLTIDASKSMSNEKWDKTQTVVVSLIYAISQIKSLDIKVFYRMTNINANKIYNINEITPVILKAFDSTVDSFEKVKHLFAYLKPNGGSPEGLIFNKIISQMNNEDIFINISDGEPEFYNNNISFTGDLAIEYTKNEMLKLHKKNIKYLSFFIGNSENFINFVKMYGKKQSTLIEDNQVNKIIHSLNNILI